MKSVISNQNIEYIKYCSSFLRELKIGLAYKIFILKQPEKILNPFLFLRI